MAASDHQIALDIALGRIVQVLTPTLPEWDKRNRLVEEHCQRLSTQLNSPHPIRVSPFGSSLSGLCLADSDIDLGLFGRFNGCQLENLRPQQQQNLLRLVLKAIQQAKLTTHRVQAIWGARIPVLKYTCALSHLECDISLQGTGALVKAHVIRILNQNCSTLSALYRLVKLWAQAHDLNDASRSTFNSTSLLYMTIFYLQQLNLLPPLRELVPPQLLTQPTERLLQGRNKNIWEDTTSLQRLLDAVQQRMLVWRRQQQQQADRPLGELLCGFWQLWSSRLAEWVLNQHRDMHADLWHGTWTRGSFSRPYIFSLQDPFDATDCPARAVGSSNNTNGGTAAFIAYMFSSSSKVMQRYNQNCKHAAAEVASLQPPGDSNGQQLYGSSYGSSSSWPGSDTAESAQHTMQHELCKVLAWLFGPQAVLLLGSEYHQRQHHTSRLPPAPVAASYAWAQHPFQPSLVVAVQQKKRQCSSQVLLAWLVTQLRAALDPSRNVLCLQHLGLLSQQSLAAASAVRNEHAAARSSRRRDSAAAADQVARQQQTATSEAESESTQEPQSEQLLATAAAQQQQQQQQVVLLHGPPLPNIDVWLTELKQSLEADVSQLAYALRQQPEKHPSPKRQPRKVKDAAQRCMREVLARVQQLEQQASASSNSNCSSSVRYGLMAVLQQHGFTPLLEQWSFIKDGVLWERLLPAADILGEPEDSDAARKAAPAAAAVPTRPEPGGVSSDRLLDGHPPQQFAVATAPPAVSAATSCSKLITIVANSSGSAGRQEPQLLKLVGKSCPIAGLKALYRSVSSANRLKLLHAGGVLTRPAAEALAAATAATDNWTWFSCEYEQQGEQQGVSLQHQISTESSPPTWPDSDHQAQWYVTAHLPPLLVLQSCGQMCSLNQLAPACNVRELLRVSGPMIQKRQDFTHRIGARAALLWLERQPNVVQVVSALLAGGQPEQQLQHEGSDSQARHNSSATASSSTSTLEAIQQETIQHLQQRNGEKHVQVRVVKAPSLVGQQAAAEAAAATAATAAAANLTRPHLRSAVVKSQKQQQPSCIGADASTTAAVGIASHLNGLTLDQAASHALSTDSNSFCGPVATTAAAAEAEAEAQAEAAREAAARAKAERAYSIRLRQLREQIRSTERRLQQKEKQLKEDEELLAELQQEEQAALTAAGIDTSSSSSSTGAANSNSTSSSSSSTGVEASGMMLLDLALQQSAHGMLKELRHDLNNAKCKVQAGRETIRQLRTNIQKLQQEEAALAAAGVEAFVQQQQQQQQQQQREQEVGQRSAPQQCPEQQQQRSAPQQHQQQKQQHRPQEPGQTTASNQHPDQQQQQQQQQQQLAAKRKTRRSRPPRKMADAAESGSRLATAVPRGL